MNFEESVRRYLNEEKEPSLMLSESYNLHIVAKKGGKETELNVLQTPTKVTKKILNSKSPLRSYISYVKDVTDGDKDRMEIFLKKIKQFKKQGYKLEFFGA